MDSIKKSKEKPAENKQPERTKNQDPVLLMLGVGKELWEQEPGDRFIDRLRREEPTPSRE
jgi:hypothetical protein